MKVSLFENYLNSAPLKTVDLFDWLIQEPTKEQLELINRIRNGEDELKKHLPCITPSGLFEPKRAVNNLVTHSNYIFIDIDGKENLHIKSIQMLKGELIKIKEVVYCAFSVSNNGLHLIFKLAHPEKHLQHFEYLFKYFKNKGITIDAACKDVSRLKGMTYDEKAYFNRNAPALERYAPNKPQTVFKPTSQSNDKETVWDCFNRTANVPQMLESYGFTFIHQKGARMRYTRPGKTNGISIDFCIERRIIYFFTSSTPVEEGGKQPFTVFAKYEFGGNKSEAAKFLIKKHIRK